jgi:phosphate transport system substrate-binding protein
MNLHRCAFLLTLAAACCTCTSCGSSNTVTIQGSGATFPEPLYQRWFNEYNRLHSDVRVNYAAQGSSTGIRQFTDGLVNFGASDAAMTDDEMSKVEGGVQLLPMTAGSIVLAYNTEDLPEDLKLSRKAYSGICLGEITKWNDPEILKHNKDADLPNKEITLVGRAGGSGTTYAFTKHLSAISKKWEEKTGATQNWPTQIGVSGNGNEGVAALIQKTPGAIGYVEFSYAEHGKLPTALLENKEGKFIKATIKSGQAALAGFELPDDMRAWVTDPAGKKSYPIVTYTWLLCHKKYDDEQVGNALKELIKYCLTDGQKISEELGYLPLPEKVAAKVLKAVDNIKP